EVIEVFPADVECPLRAGLCGLRRQLPGLDERAHLQQSGVGADWAGVLTDELHAVVIGRVVARRHRDAAVEFFRKRSEVRALRAPQADVESIDTGIDQAALECRGQLRAREPD